jgi:hypothetical protein
MENPENITSEQVNVLLTGQVAADFRDFMADEILQTKSAAGYKLIVEGLRRWKANQDKEAAA